MSNLFCIKCGSAIPEGYAFCPNCGEAVIPTPVTQPQQPQYQQPQYQQPVYQQPVYQQPVYRQTSNYEAQPNLLVFGILSLAFFIVAGIILGAIGRSKGNAYMAGGGQLTGASRVGFILCKVGLILSIVLTAFFAIAFIIALSEEGWDILY